MARNLEGITKDYWDISHALRSPHTERVVSAQDAFKALSSADYLRPDEDWRLKDLMHVIRFDIIEGNTEWRGNPQAANSASILHMKDWMSIQRTQEVSSRMATQSR